MHDNAKTPVEMVEGLCQEVQSGVEKIKANVPNWVPPPVKNRGDEATSNMMRPHIC